MLISDLDLIITYNCDTTEPLKVVFNLFVEDISSTEVWLKLSTGFSDYPQEVDLFIDGKYHRKLQLTTKDTTLFIENLKVTSSYTCQIQNKYIKRNIVSFTHWIQAPMM